MNDRLVRFLAAEAKRAGGRWWAGPVPALPDLDRQRWIAARIGYPTASIDPFGSSPLDEITRDEAAHVLAVATTISLAYEAPIPGPAAMDAARGAIAETGGATRFFANGRWRADACEWMPLSDATFDCGVMGYDAAAGFVFWVEEED